MSNGDKLAAPLADPTVIVPGFDTSRVMALISLVLADPATPKKRLLRAVGTVYLFEVENGKGEKARWYLDVKKRGRVGSLKLDEKAPLKPDVTVKISDRDLVGLATGKLQPQKLYAAKLKLWYLISHLIISLRCARPNRHFGRPDGQRLQVRGDLDRAYLALRVVSQERQKVEKLALENGVISNREKL